MQQQKLIFMILLIKMVLVCDVNVREGEKRAERMERHVNANRGLPIYIYVCSYNLVFGKKVF